MNWADLLKALLVAGFVLPLLLAVFRLIPLTVCVTIQSAALTSMTVWSFLRGDAEGTVWYACLTVFLVLLLCRDHRRNKARRRDQEHAHVITTVKKP